MSLLENSRRPPAGRAIEFTDGRVLVHAQLDVCIAEVSRALRGLGIGAGNRVVTIFPDGPSAAVAFLAVTAAATCAPLNPQNTAIELRSALADLEPAAVMVSEEDVLAPARAVAEGLGIPLIELSRFTADNELFTLRGDRRACSERARATRRPSERDVGILLQTSGTTRSKLVPLSRDNLRSSASHIVSSLRLTNADRGMVFMPLFHVHGLIAALLAPLAAGGTVVVPPAYRADETLSWLRAHAATWYTAVPTMHRHVVAAAAHADARAHSLRFVRSCSAPLPPTLLEELEAALGVPAIEAYGMTEAAHQITSNPLPPGRRLPGSVGFAAGPEVTVLDEDGTELPRDTTGELAIRGPNVTRGYLDADDINQQSFVRGWLRTGDRGVVDADGYVTIDGRLKELINRGGEKIAPREVDEALLAHPAVEAALAFAVPHPTLGEVVAAAVVLRSGASATEAELIDHAGARLAPFKVPRSVVFVPDLPKGPTGKARRIGLAESLGIAGTQGS